PDVSGEPLTVAKYDPSCDDALLTAVALGVETNRLLLTPPSATWSVTLDGTPVTCLVSAVRAVPVGPLLDAAAVPPPLLCFVLLALPMGPIVGGFTRVLFAFKLRESSG